MCSLPCAGFCFPMKFLYLDAILKHLNYYLYNNFVMKTCPDDNPYVWVET